LQLQLRGRTPRLQAFLSILEESAASLQKDYTRISSNESSKYVSNFVSFNVLDQVAASSELVRDLVEAYLPEAKAFCFMIADALASTTDELMNEPGKTTLHPGTLQTHL